MAGVFDDAAVADAGGMNIVFASALLVLLLGEQREVEMVGGANSAGGRELIVMVGGLVWCGGDDDGIGRCPCLRCCCCLGHDDGGGRGVS